MIMTHYCKNLKKRINCRFSEETGNIIHILSNWFHCSESEVVRMCVYAFIKEHTHFLVNGDEN